MSDGIEDAPVAGSRVTTKRSARFVEARSIDYVPLAERHGKAWHLFGVWFAGNAHLLTVALGFIGIALGGNLIWTAIAVITGCAFGTFFMAFHSTQGPQLGLPQMVQSRPQFGFVGALLVWVVALIIYVGFSASVQVLVGGTMQSLVGLPTGVSYIGFAVIGAVLAVVGYDLIHKASRLLTFLMLVVLVVFTVGIVVGHPFTAAALDIDSFSLAPFLAQFFAAAVYQLSWAIFVSDYSRYLPPTVRVRASFWWTYLGAGISGAWMMLVGTVAAALFPTADAVGALISVGDTIVPGFGRILLIAAVLPMITAGTLCFYGGSLTLLSSMDSIKQIKPTLGKRIGTLVFIGTVSTVIAFSASASFITWLEHLLVILGYLLTPWTAINLIDFYVVRRGHYSIREIFNPRGLYQRWAWRGLSAYFLGFAAMVPFAVVGDIEGPAAGLLGGVDVSMLVGLVASSAIYLVAHRGFDLSAERDRIRVADFGIEPGDTVPAHG